LTKEQIAPFILPESRRSVAVFVNGHFAPELSSFEGLPKKVVAIPLQDALRSFGSFINNQVAKLLQEEVDPFAALNAAFSPRALFLYVPPNTIFEAPFQILQIIGEQAEMCCPRLELFFGALSEAHVVGTAAYLAESSGFLNATAHFILEEGSKISYSRLLLNAPSQVWHLDATRATLKKDSTFNSYIVQQGAETYRDDYRIALVGPNAEVYLAGVGMLSKKRESHTHVFIDHQSPECRSMQLFKGVLNDSSRASFEGKIYVQRAAQKTQAFQLNNNLLLSDDARANSKPNLEIFADDVKASHGATVGQLDADQLFYLTARGLALAAAKNLLVQGFCHEVIDQIPVQSIRDAGGVCAANYLGG
jgi:Fe-S cluster assembly protein SufD